jgi:hypothetical protein
MKPTLTPVPKHFLEMPLLGGFFTLYIQDGKEWKMLGCLCQLLADMGRKRLAFCRLVCPDDPQFVEKKFSLRVVAIAEGRYQVMAHTFHGCRGKQILAATEGDDEALTYYIVEFASVTREVAEDNAMKLAKEKAAAALLKELNAPLVPATLPGGVSTDFSRDYSKCLRVAPEKSWLARFLDWMTGREKREIENQARQAAKDLALVADASTIAELKSEIAKLDQEVADLSNEFKNYKPQERRERIDEARYRQQILWTLLSQDL